MDTMHFKDMISNNDVVKLLEEVGFSEMKGNEEVGYLLKNKNVYYGVRGSQDIEVYLKRGYLKIHLTPAFINLDIYKADSFTYIHHGRGEVIPSSWYMVKRMKLRKDSESCMSDFRDFLLLSICRDSFLSPEEEENAYIYMRRKDRWNMDYDFEYRDWYV
jgi:hypothetical protein